MHPPEIVPTPDVAAAFVDVVLDAFARRKGPNFSLVLSGGPTARVCYELLAEESGGSIDWASVDVFMGDERFVSPDDPDSNQRQVRESLLERVAPVHSFSPMPTTGTPQSCVDEYQKVIAELLCGAGIDLIHLGMGPDGHTASLFKGVPALNATDAELVAATVDPTGKNPYPRLTLTLPAINQARLAVFTVSGSAKQDAVQQLLRGDDIPASRVDTPEIKWLLDAQALGLGDNVHSIGASDG